MLGTLVLSGCSSKFKVIDSNTDSELSADALLKSRIVVNNAIPGTAVSTNKLYDLSGIYLSNCLKDMILNYNSNVKLDSQAEELPNLLKRLKKNNNVDYLVYGKIINWEDHPTEWNGIPDRISIELKLIRISDEKVLASESFIASSKWFTFGGAHPQDLLAKPLTDILYKWFGESVQLNPDNYECEDSMLKSDY